MKVHFKLSTEPLPEGQQYDMECGSKIKNSKFVMTMEPGETFPDVASTLLFCVKCLRIGLSTPVLITYYVYGVVEAAEADQYE